MPAMWGNALCPVKIAHKSNVCASLSWCLNQWLRLFPKRHVRKTLASILSKKATAVIKGRTRNLSRFGGTKPVIFKPGN